MEEWRGGGHPPHREGARAPAGGKGARAAPSPQTGTRHCHSFAASRLSISPLHVLTSLPAPLDGLAGVGGRARCWPRTLARLIWPTLTCFGSCHVPGLFSSSFPSIVLFLFRRALSLSLAGSLSEQHFLVAGHWRQAKYRLQRAQRWLLHSVSIKSTAARIHSIVLFTFLSSVSSFPLSASHLSKFDPISLTFVYLVFFFSTRPPLCPALDQCLATLRSVPADCAFVAAPSSAMAALPPS